MVIIYFFFFLVNQKKTIGASNPLKEKTMKATSPALYNSEGPAAGDKKSNTSYLTTSEFRKPEFENNTTVNLGEKEVNNFFREKQPIAAKNTPKLKDPIEFENLPTYFAVCENSG